MTEEETLLRQAQLILNSRGATDEEREVAELTIRRLESGGTAQAIGQLAKNALSAINEAQRNGYTRLVDFIGSGVESFFNPSGGRGPDANPITGQNPPVALEEPSAVNPITGQLRGSYVENPGDPLAQTIAPERLAELEAEGVVAPGEIATVPDRQPLNEQPILDSIENFGTSQIPPASPGGTPAPQAPAPAPAPAATFDPAAQNFYAEQIAQAQVAQIQNALQVDELNRAAAAANLLVTPQAGLNQNQLLANAALVGQPVPTSFQAALPAFQQLQGSADVRSNRPAINANVAQQQSVNRVNQGAERDRLKALQEAQKLAAIRRQQFIENFAIPVLGRSRDN